MYCCYTIRMYIYIYQNLALSVFWWYITIESFVVHLFALFMHSQSSTALAIYGDSWPCAKTPACIPSIESKLWGVVLFYAVRSDEKDDDRQMFGSLSFPVVVVVNLHDAPRKEICRERRALQRWTTENHLFALEYLGVINAAMHIFQWNAWLTIWLLHQTEKTKEGLF